MSVCPRVICEGTLEFLAIQSIDSASMELGARKFQIAQKVQHEAVLQIFKWCETVSEVRAPAK